MANGQIIERLANSPVLDRLEAIAKVGMELRNRLGRNPTNQEVSIAVAQHVEASPATTADVSMENNNSSRIVRGQQMSMQAWVLMAIAVFRAWKAGDWDAIEVQLTIALPFIIGLLGNAIALFGRLARNPDPDFRIWKPTSWFRSA